MQPPSQSSPANPIAGSINGIGLDVYRSLVAESDGNVLLSPYSIELALAMTLAGADGVTRTEMQRSLRLPADDEHVASQFGDLAKQLAEDIAKANEHMEEMERFGLPGSPTELAVANRLFVQKDYPLRQPFVDLLSNPESYHAPIEQLDLREQAEHSRGVINTWVEEQTKRKICDIIPREGVSEITSLVLVNAIYLCAPWRDEFPEGATAPEPFAVNGKTPVDVPTMKRVDHLGYARIPGFVAVALPFAADDLWFLILLPDVVDGLSNLEQEITPDTFCEVAREISAEAQRHPWRRVDLHLPKFRIEPTAILLSTVLKTLGMKTAFDEPKGSANFDRMAPWRPEDYPCIGEVFHKAFLALDEKGVEAAAATVVAAVGGFARRPEEPVKVRVDRPFLFAIQHKPSGSCLFLGRVTDPR